MLTCEHTVREARAVAPVRVGSIALNGQGGQCRTAAFWNPRRTRRVAVVGAQTEVPSVNSQMYEVIVIWNA